MNTDLELARSILTTESCTCVLCRDGKVYKSTFRGVRPLMEFLESGEDFHGFSAADKVVGKATAFLYCLLGVKAVHANVISEPALQVLKSHGIDLTWDQQVSAIRNRTGDGLCPMEMATRDIDDPALAPAAIRAALARLTNST